MSVRSHQVEQLCREYRVKALYVFGSRTAQMLRALADDGYLFPPSPSDLDVGVLTHFPFSIDDKVNLTLALETIFAEPCVDLFLLQEADAFLAANIIRGERIFVEDPYSADEYELYVLRRAGDFAELERARMTMILQET
jgi:predicted nucleotidyltransferase